MSKRKRTRKPFDAFLPATACSQELRDKLQDYAEKEEISIADAIRKAVALFLSRESQKVADSTSK